MATTTGKDEVVDSSLSSNNEAQAPTREYVKGKFPFPFSPSTNPSHSKMVPQHLLQRLNPRNL